MECHIALSDSLSMINKSNYHDLGLKKRKQCGYGVLMHFISSHCNYNFKVDYQVVYISLAVQSYPNTDEEFLHTNEL